MKVAYKSDIGKKRKNNEDHIQVDLEKGIFILADGMGGHQAGEVASDLAVREAYAYLLNGIDKAGDEKEISKFLLGAMFKAHEVTKEKAKADPHLREMGTTLVVLVIRDGKAHVCHIGDSRAYLLRKEMKQITKDHTVGAYLVANNFLQPNQVHPQQWHTLTQAVGPTENLVPEINHVEVYPGDFLLLCSDGLTDMLSDEEIRKLVQKYGDDVSQAVEGLVKEANRNGGEDNISVVLIEFE